ncbi:MAG: TrkA family potassium uptake protein [Geodermatophilaceae bacterium]|nr:TrkA family potassium uptake protein [Geodermatophilaceae bacterium]
MHIVIMGCGRVGSSIARSLEDLGHSVAVIDRNQDAFRRLGPEFGGRQVLGMGFDREVLRKAGIQKAGAFAAVSSGDNSNIVAARVARETFGIDRVVARIYDPKRAAVYERLGIPTVATVPWTTDQLLRRLLAQGPAEEWRDASGEVVILQLPLHDSWIGQEVGAFESATKSRVAYVKRFGETFLPRSHTVLQQGDQVHVLSLEDQAGRCSRIAGQARSEAS